MISDGSVCNIGSPEGGVSSQGTGSSGRHATQHLGGLSPGYPDTDMSGDHGLTSGRPIPEVLSPEAAGYKVERGARVPRYNPYVLGTLDMGGVPSSGPIAEEVAVPPAGSLHPSASPSYVKGPNTSQVGLEDNGEEYCCGCGELADASGPPYECMEEVEGGICGHKVCQQCYVNLSKNGRGPDHCECHDDTPNVVGPMDSPGPGGQGRAGTSDPALTALLSALVASEGKMAEAVRLLAKNADQTAGPRSTMKTVQTLEFPQGDEAALENLDLYMEEFTRVLMHISQGREVSAQDKITHLLAAWPHTTHVGENLRLGQQTPSYRQLELMGDFDGCWEILEKTLRSYPTPPAPRRRRAQAYWSAWQWPADNDIKRASTLCCVGCSWPVNATTSRHKTSRW